MKGALSRCPIWAIVLVVLACIRFEYNAASWSIWVPGLPWAVVVLGIIAVVLLFRIFNRVQDICIKKGLLAGPLRYRYDLLILIGILAVGVKARWYGGFTEDAAGEAHYRWQFFWSDATWDVPFIAAVTLLVLLLRVHTLLKGIAAQGAQQPEDLL